MNKKLKIAVAGLGGRGKDIYAQAQKQFPEDCEIVAIADIDPQKVDEVAKMYNLPESACFDSAESMLEEDKLADAMVIATQDRQHYAHAIPALNKGYHLLLEKPISPDMKEAAEIVRVANENQRTVIVCHVLRYSKYFKRLKDMLDSKTIGDIVTVMGIENVGYWHQAHSFVRGNWRDSHTTSPMILQKCCHDMDLLLWLTNKECKSVSSFGSLSIFKEEKAPEGAAKRCLDGCKVKEECPYDAEKIYITNKSTGILHKDKDAKGKDTWPYGILTHDLTKEGVLKAIKEGPYGRCVYHCDNNVVDHQVVNLLMTDDSTISFTMTAFTNEISRYTKFMGTRGEIIADMAKNTILVQEFGKEPQLIDMNKEIGKIDGHGGGDLLLVKEFIDIIGKGKEPDSSVTSIERSTESHYIAMAAEESRLQNGKVINL